LDRFCAGRCRWAVLGTSLLLVITGCSSFNRDWKMATSSTSGPSSGWDGEWRSELNAHHGRLRAIIVPLSPDRHHVRFRASYAGILRFGYSMDWAIRPLAPGTNIFTGSADLGIWGSYGCEGTLSADTMEARYDAARDHGVFRLNRVEPPPVQSAPPRGHDSGCQPV
jgi:hypothetical protein